MRANLRQALRAMCLPITQADEMRAANALRHFYSAEHISYTDCLEWTKAALVAWQDSGDADSLILEAVSSVFAATWTHGSDLDGEKYFALHKSLMRVFSLGHTEAVAFLSHLRLAVDLALLHNLSAAKISQVLSKLDSRVSFSRQNVKLVLDGLGLVISISESQIRKLTVRDQIGESALFSDADLETGALIVESAAGRVGYVGALARDLLVLAPGAGATLYVPHLQILHYQCCLLEFYDHSAVDLYEFSPRGSSGMWLFEQYGDNLAQAGNPYLNNAKAVGVMDRAWVESKKITVRPGALSLYNILTSLETMSFAGRREAAFYIRSYAFLFLRVSGNTPCLLPNPMTSLEIEKLVEVIAEQNTKSFGILEQRLLDSLVRGSYEGSWRFRGFGDSVNATNLSRRKLGDCDCQHPETRSIVAYEAHGGYLTDVYVAEHVQTLRKVIPMRRLELESVADIAEWTATIVFVAHQVQCANPGQMIIDGLRISFKFTTFASFAAGVDRGNLVQMFSTHFTEPIQERRTPEMVRLQVLSILAN